MGLKKTRVHRSPTAPIFLTLHGYLHTGKTIKIFVLLVGLARKLGSVEGKIWGLSV